MIENQNYSQILSIKPQKLPPESTNFQTDDSINYNQVINQENFKILLRDKKFLNHFLIKESPKFFEDFELGDFLNEGGCGVVYDGRMRKRKNKQKLAFKFKYSRKGNDNKD